MYKGIIGHITIRHDSFLLINLSLLLLLFSRQVFILSSHNQTLIHQLPCIIFYTYFQNFTFMLKWIQNMLVKAKIFLNYYLHSLEENLWCQPKFKQCRTMFQCYLNWIKSKFNHLMCITLCHAQQSTLDVANSSLIPKAEQSLHVLFKFCPPGAALEQNIISITQKVKVSVTGEM